MEKNDKRRRSMKFSTRIVISFAAIIIVPVILMIAAYTYTMTAMVGTYGIESEESLYNNTFMLSKLTDSDYKKLKRISVDDSEKLTELSYLESFNEGLGKEYAFLVVRTGDEIIFNGSKNFNNDEVEEALPEYGNEITNEDEWTNIRTDDQIMIRQVDFISADGQESSAFIVINMNKMYPGLKEWMLKLIFIGLVVLVATVFVITLWIYWGISKPVNKLKKATQNIRDGNLDFTVEEASSIDEINELCEDFEDMRKRLKDSQEEKVRFDSENNELIRNISHDLKTPITAVKGYCEGIMDGIADSPEKMDKYIRTIYNKANEMDRLINELTYYSKIDTNRMPYTFTKINVREYFDDCCDELALELERENVQFTYINNMTENALVIADAEQLRRAIHNIINNSVKYMDKKERKIELRLSDSGDFILVEIEDNGKGIAKKDQPRVFDRFYRTDASRNSTRGGSGIGLSIVKKILEDHGGKVWAGGEEGVGTVMSFILRKYQEVPYNE